MLRDVFYSIGDTQIYGILSTLVFVVFFILLIINAASMKKQTLDEFSRMPFEDISDNSEEIHDIKR